eukprot:3474004-Rhodomonas_salina.1
MRDWTLAASSSVVRLVPAIAFCGYRRCRRQTRVDRRDCTPERVLVGLVWLIDLIWTQTRRCCLLAWNLAEKYSVCSPRLRELCSASCRQPQSRTLRNPIQETAFSVQFVPGM